MLIIISSSRRVMTLTVMVVGVQQRRQSTIQVKYIKILAKNFVQLSGKKHFDLFELEKIVDLDFFEIFEKLLTKNFFLDLYNHFPGASIAAATAVSPLARRVVNTPLSMAYRKFALEVKTAVVKDFSIFFSSFCLI
jgi:hypothetical protein